MNPPLRRVGISLGLIDNLHDGLGEFSVQLVTRIAAAAPGWRERFGVHFDIHLRPPWRGRFGDAVGYLDALDEQKNRHRQPQPYALWHVLHQHCRQRAPEGTPLRVVTVHDLNFLYGSSVMSRWRYRRRLRQLLGRSDEVVAISRHTAADVRRHLHWRGPLEVIHNGARSLVGAAQAPLPGFDADAPAPFLFHLSRMSPSKNPQALLALAAAWPQMRFVLCGPPSADSEALSSANRLPNVEFHLGISDAQKAWAYAHCSGFLFPSLTEGFGLPPIEAMHFGKPVFLSRLTALPEIGGEVAHYFDSFEPAAMRAVVEQGLVTAAARADAVRAHAAQFSWDRCAGAYLALYASRLGLAPGWAADEAITLA